MKKKDKNRPSINKHNNDIFYLDVYGMKVDCKEKDMDCYDFNSFRDELVDECDARVYPLNDGDVMAIEGVDKKTIREVGKNHGMNVTKYLSKDNNIDDDVNYRNTGDSMNEEDIPTYDEIGVEEIPSYDSVDYDRRRYDGIPDYDSIDVSDADYAREIDKCNALIMDDFADGIGFDQFEANIDDYVARYMGIDVDELCDIDDDEIESVREKLISAWRRLENGYPEMHEKRRNRCCPRHSLNERLYAKDSKYQEELDGIEKRVKATYTEIREMPISVHEAREAMDKLKKENTRLKKIKNRDGKFYNIMDIAGSKPAFNKLKKVDPEKEKEISKYQSSLVEKVKVCLRNGKKSLHENVKVNGKAFKDMSLKELSEIYKRNKKSADALYEAQVSNPNVKERKELREKRAMKLMLLEYLDQEMTYRYTRAKCLKRLNEDEDQQATIPDEELENIFGAASTEDGGTDANENEEKKGENDDDVKEVPVDVVKIEFVSNEAAENLKTWCADAGIPEDEMEIHPIEDEDDEKKEDESENGEEKKEESEDDNNGNGEEKSEEETNEAYLGYNIRKLLFEDEGTDAPAEENGDNGDNGDGDASGENRESGDGNDGENGEDADPHVMFVLTNQKYIKTLINVLNDRYGISKEEFEEEIGGEIVEQEDEEEATEEGDDSKKDNEGGEDTEKKEEEIDPNDLFNGL